MTTKEHDLPHRSNTISTNSTALSEDEAIPDEDNTEITRLFDERLKAWKHACGYLEHYVTATEKLHHSLGKDYEKVLKTVEKPLKEGEHFDQSLGGIAGLFDNLRTNTQAIANSHLETAKALKGSVLPVFDRLHSEVKHKSKELIKGAGKGSKAVEKARNSTQKHIELLGQHSANYDSTGGKVDAAHDPYVLQRGVVHRLNKQIQEENANRQDLLAVQDNFASFESHVVKQIQAGLGQFNAVIAKQDDVSKSLYGDILANAQRVPPNFEWQGFLKRYSNILLDPSAPERNINNVSFPNQDHRATKPLISGSLDRKGKLLKRYDTGFYVVTASKFLHEYKSDDDFAKDPTPDNSLFLPDCVIGALDGAKFVVKGKDVNKNKLGLNLSTSHDYSFKAHTAADAAQWYEVIRQAAGQVTNELPEASAPNTPVVGSTSEGEKFGSVAPTSAPGTHTHAGQETGVTPATTHSQEHAPVPSGPGVAPTLGEPHKAPAATTAAPTTAAPTTAAPATAGTATAQTSAPPPTSAAPGTAH